MVIDSSAIVTILLREPDASIHQSNRERSLKPMSAATLVRASMVIETCKGEAGGQKLDLFIYRADIKILSVAGMARRQYGKGRHPVGLNYGDCFSYALARTRGASLLFKGNNFTQADL
jgi:ribonuclease VapC